MRLARTGRGDDGARACWGAVGATESYDMLVRLGLDALPEEGL